MLNLLPGPVTIAPKVQAAFAAQPLWHRGGAFLHTYQETKNRLLDLTKSSYVALLMGSGSVANAVVAHELNKLSTKGLILTNGEFGLRLARQAKNAGLDFDVYDAGLGHAFSPDTIKQSLADKDWIWLTQCETSTGALNLEKWLLDYCITQNIKICLDSISAIGSVNIDFSNIYLASGASGKGLESYAGIAMVFYNHTPLEGKTLYEYIDLNTYHNTVATPFTFSSPLLFALNTALQSLCIDTKIEHVSNYATRLKEILNTCEIKTALHGAVQSDHVWTLALPAHISSSNIGEHMEKCDVFVHYKNSYLIENNYIQLAFMTIYDEKKLFYALELLVDIIKKP